MKSILMFAMLLVVSSSAFAVPKSWVSEGNKTVLIAFDPKLSVKLFKLDVDDQTYGQLNVELSYDYKDMTAQSDEVMKAYPGYLMQKVILQKSGSYQYDIPALKITGPIDPRPGIDGPYLTQSHYVSKAEYGALAKLIQANQPVVTITGQLLATVPVVKVVEHKELSPDVCANALAKTATLAGLMNFFASADASSLGLGSFQFDSTRAALLNDMRTTCFDLDQPVKLFSFNQLMNTPLKVRPVSRQLVGETLQKTYDRADVVLNYSSSQAVAP